MIPRSSPLYCAHTRSLLTPPPIHLIHQYSWTFSIVSCLRLTTTLLPRCSTQAGRECSSVDLQHDLKTGAGHRRLTHSGSCHRHTRQSKHTSTMNPHRSPRTHNFMHIATSIAPRDHTANVMYSSRSYSHRARSDKPSVSEISQM